MTMYEFNRKSKTRERITLDLQQVAAVQSLDELTSYITLKSGVGINVELGYGEVMNLVDDAQRSTKAIDELIKQINEIDESHQFGDYYVQQIQLLVEFINNPKLREALK